MRKAIKRCLLSILMVNLSVIVFAQTVSDKTIIITKKVISETVIMVESITNTSGYDVEIITRNGSEQRAPLEVLKGASVVLNLECTLIQANPKGEGAVNGGGGTIWNKKKTATEWQKLQAGKVTSEPKPAEKPALSESKVEPKAKQSHKEERSQPKEKRINGKTIIVSFAKELEKDPYWSNASIDHDIKEIDRHIESIKNWTDRELYISSNNLIDYIKSNGKKIEEFKKGIDATVDDFISRKYRGYEIVCEFDYRDSIKRILEARVPKREIALANLNAAIDASEDTLRFDLTKLNDHFITIGIATLAVAILLFVIGLSIRRKNKKQQQQINISNPSSNDDSPAIIVRKVTTSVLKEQSLNDVINNTAYFKIESADFCDDSAVKQIYIKNTCVKDIYNMYADDLRNPNNPKEDGCMVLGRWIYDDKTKEYCVSLEEIVKPGDDAVFQEYELNFGGKIKLRVAERLRKLRKTTNLQYDLTCWVHSHPGLGIFFSNSDCNVQMQLKHPTHPNFLIAIVVDILTPKQDFGIFTFKHDSTINSHTELKKMYSLDELYHWAVESDRNSYKPEDHYNILSKAERVNSGCQGVQLSNGAIIDISSITTDQNSGLSGWVYGFKTNSTGKEEYVVNSVLKADGAAGRELVGCLVVGTHCSIPSIRKAVSEYADRIKFVIFYSAKDETITTIPMVDMQLSMDEKSYAEEKLEDLKIWTRRKR